MSLEQNKDLARRAIALWSTGEMDSASEIFTPDYINHQPHSTDDAHAIHGLEKWKDFIIDFRRAFPDLHDTIEDQVAEGDRVVTRFTSAGTHKGKGMNLPPSNKKIRWSGIAIDRIATGKIAESWVVWDKFGMLEQLGAASRCT
ncbi:MAG TPA: ester cyclase [Acetobacteraceae bacterium]|nr:ester cyclase [Acetobacteraceae bacterium]